MSISFVAIISSIILLSRFCDPSIAIDVAYDLNKDAEREMWSGNYQEALRLSKWAAAKDNLPDTLKREIYENIGDAFMYLNLPDSALPYFTQVVKWHESSSYEYLANMGKVHAAAGNTDEAIPKLTKAAKLNPDDLFIQHLSGLIYLGDYGIEYRDPEKALPYNVRAYDLNQNKTIRSVLARNYLVMGRYLEAGLHYDYLIENYPEILTYRLYMGIAKFKLGEKAAAEKQWDIARKGDASFIPVIEQFKQENK